MRALPAQLGIVTGLAAEAKLARRLSDRVACSGGDPAIAARQALELVAAGAQALMSFGIAGGLAPGLRPGTLIVASEIISDDTRYVADPGLTATLTRSLPAIDLSHRGRGIQAPSPSAEGRLFASRRLGALRAPAGEGRGGGVVLGTIYGGGVIVANVPNKAALSARIGALAVDLESGPVARVAAEASIPFVALRAIADPAWRGLPPAALVPLSPSGSPDLAAVFASIAKRPGQIPGLIWTALDTRAALGALLRACRVLVL